VFRHSGCHVVVALAAALAPPAGVWAQAEIPEGYEVIEIARSPWYVRYPRINNCGQIVFDWQYGPDGNDREIFLYDNGGLVRLTDNDVYEVGAWINEAGDIVWSRETLPPNQDQIILWRDSREWIVDECGPDEMTITPRINDLGWVAWGRGSQYGCFIGDLLLWDGVRTRRISERNDREDYTPAMNGLGDVAWVRMDACAIPWTSDIRFWSEGKRMTMPSARIQLHGPTTNDRRQVAWDGDGGIEIWEDGRTRLLTDSGGVPHLNNLGDVQFWRPGQYNIQCWLYRAEDQRFFRLVDDPLAQHSSGDVNDWREVVWHWGYGPPERRHGVMFLRRVRTGDSQFDGAINAGDYRDFADCMTAPGRVDRLCDCRFLDLDYDGDVDLGDFARFQNAFQGP